MKSITITRPDDWHIHLRDGSALDLTVADAARYFGRAIIMPNLSPPIIDTISAQDYRERILAALKRQRPDSHFQPLMTLYLTDNTSAAQIQAAHQSNLIYGVKLYPSGATTNSEAGVTKISSVYPVLEKMQELGMPLLIHGEVTEHEIDIFDREKIFIDNQLGMIRRDFPELKMVIEHITTRYAKQFVEASPAHIGATITAHHLLFNRNHMLVGGIKPHFFCLPVLKRRSHQEALIEAAVSGNKQFFLGTDSAPHASNKKESACGCAGCYTAHAAIEMYAEVFDQANSLERLEGFASHFGADFYGLARNQDTITLSQQPWQVPKSLQLADEVLTPLQAGDQLSWQVTAC